MLFLVLGSLQIIIKQLPLLVFSFLIIKNSKKPPTTTKIITLIQTKAVLPAEGKGIDLVLKQSTNKIFWSASLPHCPREQPKPSASTVTQLACPGKGTGTITWPESASTCLHCTSLSQRQQGILYIAAIQLLQGFLKRHLRRGGNKHAKMAASFRCCSLDSISSFFL